MNMKLINIIGIAASAVGIGATIATNWVGDKRMDEQIAIKVAEAISKLNKKS